MKTCCVFVLNRKIMPNRSIFTHGLGPLDPTVYTDEQQSKGKMVALLHCWRHFAEMVNGKFGFTYIGTTFTNLVKSVNIVNINCKHVLFDKWQINTQLQNYPPTTTGVAVTKIKMREWKLFINILAQSDCCPFTSLTLYCSEPAVLRRNLKALYIC